VTAMPDAIEQMERSKVLRVAGWAQEFIDGARVAGPPPLERIAVAVEPRQAGSETGIIVAGRTTAGDFYVLGDYSLDGSPRVCMFQVITARERHEADVICGVTNLVGDYLEQLLWCVLEDVRHPGEYCKWHDVEYKPVAAIRSLLSRARPVGLLYRLGYVHHAGVFPELEGQMTACGQAMPSGMPGRIGALVCAVTELKGSA
jgi:phage terminase large subunit-like protein